MKMIKVKVVNECARACGFRIMYVKNPKKQEFWKKMAEYNPMYVKIIGRKVNEK
ncbi:MAG: hypothetical protein ACE5WD_14850 [Candidatus Aminicenantia bacterium]